MSLYCYQKGGSCQSGDRWGIRLVLDVAACVRAAGLLVVEKMQVGGKRAMGLVVAKRGRVDPTSCLILVGNSQPYKHYSYYLFFLLL